MPTFRRSRAPRNLWGPTGLEFLTPGGQIASELTTTVGLDDKYYNVPLLVPDQVDVDNLLAGQKPTDEQMRKAISWAMGTGAIGYDTLEDALNAVRQRHQMLEQHYNRREQ